MAEQTIQPTNLYQYYTQQGAVLPSLSERSKIFEAQGLGSASSYQGSAAQNTALLQKLQTPAQPVQPQAVIPTWLEKAYSTPSVEITPSTGMNAADLVNYPGKLIIPETPKYDSSNAVNFWQSTAAGIQSQLADYQKNLEKSQEQMGELGKFSMVDTLSQQYEQWGISGMFDQLKTWTSEASAVRQNINDLQAQEDQALLNTEGQQVSMATIKGRQSLIIRNYNSKISSESARLSSYGAMIESVRGNLSTAQNFANQFVSAATYDYQVKKDALQQFYDYNKDIFSYMGAKYDTALKNMIDAANKEYEEQKSEKEQVAALMIQFPTAGIMTTDTLEQALAKSKTPAAQEWNLKMQQAQASISGTGAGSKYETELKNEIDKLYRGDYGMQWAREKVIANLQAKFPSMNVAEDVYTRVPSGYEKNIAAKTTFGFTNEDLQAAIKGALIED